MSEVNVQIQNPKQTVNINNPVITIEMPTDSITVEILEGQPIEIQVQNPVIEVNIGGPCDCGDGGGGTWGSITGTISDQTDLQAALDGKSNTGHTHPLSDLTQSGASVGQIARWNGAAWVPDDEAGGGPGGASYTEVTYSEMEALIAANGLTPGGWYLITDASGTDLGFLTNAVNENTPNVSGVGGYRNADFDGVGDYSGAVIPAVPYYIYYYDASGLFTVGETITGDDNGSTAVIVLDDGDGTLEVSDVTGDWNSETTFTGDTSTETASFDGYDEGAPEVPAGTQLGIWRAEIEALTIAYTNLSGGSFTVGDTITGGTTGATAVIVTDDGSAEMTAYMTSSGEAFDGSEVLDNGNGVTADQDGAASSPTIVLGDVVIWNLRHYILSDDTELNGSNPGDNTAAYTEIDKVTAPETYIIAWDTGRIRFASDEIFAREDLSGNKCIGPSSVENMSWGNPRFTRNEVLNSTIDCKNYLGVLANNFLINGATIVLIFGHPDSYFAYNSFIGSGVAENISLGENSEYSQNTHYSESVSSNIVIGYACLCLKNILENGARLTDITARANCSISGNKIEANGILGGSMVLGDGAQVNNNTILLGIEVSNKTFEPGVQFNGNTIGVSMTETETITDNIEGKRAIPGFSDIPGTIDITGLNTLDCTAAFAQYRGIYNLTSGNATETIDTITNPPTLFPFTLRPAAGVVLTITGTAYSGIAAGQIALKAASYVLDGDKGEYIVLELDPLGTGALIEKQVVNGLI